MSAYFQYGSDNISRVIINLGCVWEPTAGEQLCIGTLVTIRMILVAEGEYIWVHLEVLHRDPIWFYISNAYCVRFVINPKAFYFLKVGLGAKGRQEPY